MRFGSSTEFTITPSPCNSSFMSAWNLVLPSSLLTTLRIPASWSGSSGLIDTMIEASPDRLSGVVLVSIDRLLMVVSQEAWTDVVEMHVAGKERVQRVVITDPSILGFKGSNSSSSTPFIRSVRDIGKTRFEETDCMYIISVYLQYIQYICKYVNIYIRHSSNKVLTRVAKPIVAPV